MLTREQHEALEDQTLAVYAMKSRTSRGRQHQEPEHAYRSAFQRDRDRVVHSTAFRRLEYKTQVFVFHEGDYYRTRLTHTMEATQIARTLARALRLNEDLTEAITLAHDLGHTPFGHSGERVLDGLMKEATGGQSGFEHNRQSLRIVDLLERRYPAFPGLNLTWEVRESIAKHSSEHDHAVLAPEFDATAQSLLEAQVSNIADEIAYNAHDLDDGLTSNLLTLDVLNLVGAWKEIFGEVEGQHPSISPEDKKHMTVRRFIDAQCSDLIHTTEDSLRRRTITSVDAVRQSPDPLVTFSPRMAQRNAELKTFLLEHLYRHYKVLRMEEKATHTLTYLFTTYRNKFAMLPSSVRTMAKESTSQTRVICDYIAAMTDRFALEEYKKLTDPFERV